MLYLMRSCFHTEQGILQVEAYVYEMCLRFCVSVLSNVYTVV